MIGGEPVFPFLLDIRVADADVASSHHVVHRMKKTFKCAWCFEINEIFVDLSAGNHQQYEENCQVCCRPNTITVTIDTDTRHVTVEAEAEG